MRNYFMHIKNIVLGKLQYSHISCSIGQFLEFEVCMEILCERAFRILDCHTHFHTFFFTLSHSLHTFFTQYELFWPNMGQYYHFGV